MAYLYPALVREVFTALDEVNWEDGFRDFCTRYKISEDDLATAAHTFGETLRQFLRNADVKTIDDANKVSGFDVMPWELKAAIYQRVGESMTAGFFTCAKQATMQGAVSPLHDEYIDAIAAAKTAYKRLRDDPVQIEPVGTISRYAEEVNELKAIIRQQAATVNSQVYEISELTKKLKEQDVSATTSEPVSGSE